MERRDRDVHGGGIDSFIRSDIPARRRTDLETINFENIVYEVILNTTKWCIIGIYRPPVWQTISSVKTLLIFWINV
jgi:hypothetical protein